jgi:fumarate reductase subunit D
MKYLKLKNLILIILLVAIAFPSIAQGVQSGDDVIRVLANITTWLWRVFMIATVIAFMFAGFLYFIAAGDPDKVTRANNMVKYGLIGVVVALLSGGMVALVQSFLEG